MTLYVLGDANHSSGHVPDQFLLGSEKSCVRSSVKEWNSEPLSCADGYVDTKLPGRLEQGQGHQVRCTDGQSLINIWWWENVQLSNQNIPLFWTYFVAQPSPTTCLLCCLRYLTLNWSYLNLIVFQCEKMARSFVQYLPKSIQNLLK